MTASRRPHGRFPETKGAPDFSPPIMDRLSAHHEQGCVSILLASTPGLEVSRSPVTTVKSSATDPVQSSKGESSL